MRKIPRNSILALGFLVSLSLSATAWGETHLNRPATPVYETCSDILMSNGQGGSYPVKDTACLARNSQKQKEYNAALEAYERASRITTADASKSTKPQEPTYENCSNTDSTGSVFTDYACQARNQQKQYDYNIQISAWNVVQQQEALQGQAAESEEQRRILEAEKGKSATEALKKAEDQNKTSMLKSLAAAGITAGISAAFSAKYAASCSTSCQGALLAASIAYSIMSAKNSRQASQNNSSAQAACLAQAKLNATSVSDCSASSLSTSLVPSIYDANGNCVAADRTLCTQNLPDGITIKDVINAKTNDLAFKINPDGSITTKDGKTYKASDFKDVASLVAAGMSPAEAAAAMAMIGKSGLGSIPGNIADAMNTEDRKSVV